MADASTVSVLIQARDQASAQFQKIEGNMGKMAAGFQKHRRAIGLAATAIGGAITGIAAMSVKSSFDQQQGIRSLDQALKNVGTSYAAQKQQIEALASAQQLKTNFGDEEQRKALQELIQVSGSYDDAMAAMIPTMDLAAAKEMDLGAAATLVARAISGEETALGRYGVEVEKGAGSTAVLTEIMAKFGGQAEANADPMTQLKNRVGDLFQVLGDDLLPVLETLLPKIEAATRSIIEWTEAHPTLTKVLGLAAVAIGAILLVVGPLLLLLPTMVTAIGLVSVAFVKLNLSMGVITLVILAIAAAVAGAIIIWKNWEDMGIKMKIALAFLFPVIVGLIALIKNWDKVITTVKDNIRKFVVNIIDMGKKFLETIRSMLTFVPGMDKIKRAIDSGISKLDSMEGAMHRWADSGGAAMEDMDDESGFLAEAIETNTDKMQASFKETAEVVKESAKGWGFEVNKATGITEEMAVRTATATRNIAEAFQEAGDESMTGAQKIAAAARLAEKATAEATTKMESDWDAWMSSMDRQEKQLEEVFAGMTDEMDFFAGPQMDAFLDTHKEKLGDSIDQLDNWGARYAATLKEQGETRRELEDRTYAAGLAKFSAYIKAQEDLQAAATAKERQVKLEAFFQSTQAISPEAAAALGLSPEDANKMRARSQVEKQIENQQRIISEQEARGQTLHRHWQESAQRGDPWSVQRSANDRYVEQSAVISRAEEVLGKLRNRLPSMAGGGISGGGLALVGERGPEVVSLPGGARVHPNGTGPGTNNFIFHGAVYGLEDLRRVVVEAVRDHALSGGFRGVFGEA